MFSQKDPREIIAKAILTSGAMKINIEKPFLWASGYHMPVYIDNRALIGLPKVRKAVAKAFSEYIKKSGCSYSAIAGVATGAIPHATTLADYLDLPLLYIRPKPKDHGTGKQVEGEIDGGIAGKKILVIEDTVSTGGSSMKAVEAIRNEGAIVPTLCCIYYHDLPGTDNIFAKMNPPCNLIPLITFPYLIKRARAEKIFDEKTISELESWHKEPFLWGEKHGMPKIEPSA